MHHMADPVCGTQSIMPAADLLTKLLRISAQLSLSLLPCQQVRVYAHHHDNMSMCMHITDY